MTLLGLLDREPSHGYDLKRPYDRFFRFFRFFRFVRRDKPLPFGQVSATPVRLSALASEARS
jgi:hypothetical protein